MPLPFGFFPPATGAALLIHQPTPFQDTPKPPAAAQPSTRAIPQSPPTVFTPTAPAPISYPSDFTNQDRAFVDQAMARGLATPKTIAGLPDFAHWACTGFRDTVNRYLGIEDAGLAWDDAKRIEHQSPSTPVWPATIRSSRRNSLRWPERVAGKHFHYCPPRSDNAL